MQDQIFRVRVSPRSRLRMRALPEGGSAIVARLPHRQAVVRLNMVDYDGWYFVFADTPGEGLYTGYVSANHLAPIDADLVAALGTEELEADAEELEPVLDETAPDDARSFFLSPNFSLWEFIFSQTAIAHDIDNTPDQSELEVLKDTAKNMERVRDFLGGRPIKVNSAFRSKALNEKVGGSPTSAHKLGYAVDFVCPDFGNPYEICEAIMNSDLMEIVDQLIMEKNRWVHISFDPNLRRREVLSYFGSTYHRGLFERDPDAV